MVCKMPLGQRDEGNCSGLLGNNPKGHLAWPVVVIIVRRNSVCFVCCIWKEAEKCSLGMIKYFLQVSGKGLKATGVTERLNILSQKGPQGSCPVPGQPES